MEWYSMTTPTCGTIHIETTEMITAINKQPRPRVFVTQETELNFAPAEQFGNIEFITIADLNNIKGSLHNDKLVVDIAAKLQSFDEKTDFIVITGSPYVSALVFLLLGRRGVRNVKLLRWSNRDFNYTPMFIDVRGARA
jgi:hypothetical protein